MRTKLLASSPVLLVVLVVLGAILTVVLVNYNGAGALLDLRQLV